MANLDKNLRYTIIKKLLSDRVSLATAKNNISKVKNLKKLDVKEVSIVQESLKTHLFKYDLDEQEGCLIVKISKDLDSVEGFNLGKDIILTVNLF